MWALIITFLFLPLATCSNENQVTFNLMASLGSSSDKTYSHGYHRHYPSLFASQNLDRTSAFRMIEIGFGQGSSVSLWENLFPNADIIWIDYSSDPGDRVHCVPGKASCQAGTRSRFYFGSQSNATFLRSVVQEECGTLPCFDIIIDDGGHGYQQQLISFQVLFSTALKPGGMHLIEDIETSYWTYGEQYGDLTIGGRKAKHTPVNVFKRFVDVVNSEFFDHGFVSDVRVGKRVENMIKSVSFAHNLMSATKKNAMDQELDRHMFNNRSYRFRFRVEGWKYNQEDVQPPTLEENDGINDATDTNWCVERMNRLPKSMRGRSRHNDDEDAIQFFEDMCRLQGQVTSCDQQRSVEYTPMGSGIGAGFHLLAHATTFALSDGRILLEDVRKNWVDLELPRSISLNTYFHPPTPCGTMKLDCYLAPIHRCKRNNNDDTMKGRAEAYETLNVWNIDHVMKHQRNGEKSVRAAWYSFRLAQLINGWGSIQEFVPKKYQHRGLLWFKSQMVHWLIQPSIRVSNAVRELQIKMGLNRLSSNAKIVVMHVRRGDKANDPIIKQQNNNGGGGFHIKLAKYVDSARKIHSLHFDKNEPLRILIMTESQSVIDETKTFPDVVWYFTTDHKRQIKKNIKISDEIQNGNSNGEIEMMIGLRNLFLSVVEGNAFVGSFSSNWSRLVFEMMYAYNGIVPPHKSMDLDWYP